MKKVSFYSLDVGDYFLLNKEEDLYRKTDEEEAVNDSSNEVIFVNNADVVEVNP